MDTFFSNNWLPLLYRATRRRRLAGSIFCMLILASIYVCEVLFPSAYTDMFSSSLMVFFWAFLLGGALCWTYSDSDAIALYEDRWVNTYYLMSMMLVVANDLFPTGSFLEEGEGTANTWLHTYMLPLVAVFVIMLLMLTQTLVKNKSFHKLLQELNEKVQSQRMKRSSQLSADANGRVGELLYKVFSNESIAQCTNEELKLLLDFFCNHIDSNFGKFRNAKKEFPLTERDSFFCILVRCKKSNEDIRTILGMTEESYRQMKSRVAKRLNVRMSHTGGSLESFLYKLNSNEVSGQ